MPGRFREGWAGVAIRTDFVTSRYGTKLPRGADWIKLYADRPKTSRNFNMRTPFRTSVRFIGPSPWGKGQHEPDRSCATYPGQIVCYLQSSGRTVSVARQVVRFS
jgi:hypothetical protein